MAAACKIFSVDVEDYYQAENIWSSLSSSQRDSMPERVHIGVGKILDLLSRTGNKATFFILGNLAEKNKNLIKKMCDLGHEIATHGFSHEPLTRHTPESFDEDLARSIDILSGITGRKVSGYRAPSFSLTEDTLWTLDILKKHGITYDSSVSPSLFRKSFRRKDKASSCFNISPDLLELPVASFKLGPFEVPAGGGYFRALPYGVTKRGLERGKCTPSVFYVHPWELDADQPRVKLPPLKAFRHYINLSTTEQKLARLLGEEKFTSFEESLKEIRP